MPVAELFHHATHETGAASRRSSTSSQFPRQWRCTRCDKLLGICRDGRLHVRFARGHEYLASLPVVATCRGCGTLNRLDGLTP